jgi:uncharacterized protein YdhG (YjbR/CyaY superfamily)
MKETEREYTTIDEYIALFPKEIQKRMEELRKTIRAAAPDAEEKISWAMPTFYQGGNLIHFAAAKKHIGIYPGADGVAAFADKLGDLKSTKGAIQLPNDKPLPLDLVTKIVKFKVKNRKKAAKGK